MVPSRNVTSELLDRKGQKMDSEYSVSPGAAWLLLGAQGGMLESESRNTLGDTEMQSRSRKLLFEPMRGCVLRKSRRAPWHRSVMVWLSGILRLEVFVKVYLLACMMTVCMHASRYLCMRADVCMSAASACVYCGLLVDLARYVDFYRRAVSTGGMDADTSMFSEQAANSNWKC